MSHSFLELLLEGTEGAGGIACPTPPPVVKGRTVHIDGDFICYIVAADRKDQPITTMVQATEHLKEFVANLKEYSGAEDYRFHMSSGKSGREEQARLKQYQANRQERERPVLLGEVREWARRHLTCVMVDGFEADDTISAYVHADRCNGLDPVVASQDKDLRMIPAKHIDWRDLTIKEVTFEGSLYLDEEGSTKKLRGDGGLFFLAQLLMGDSADNISGIPYVHGTILNEVDPTKETEKLTAVVNDPKSTPAQVQAATKKLLWRTGKKCGAVLAYKMLQGKTIQEAMKMVVRAYALYGMYVGFEDYDGNPISVQEALHSECKLLYLRHNLREDDFKEFFKGVQDGTGLAAFTKPSA